MRKAWFLLGMALLAACTEPKSPVAPTAIAGPAPPVGAPPLPTTVPGVLLVAMPLDRGDAANSIFGIAPFGYHSADHAAGGHPGWDIEYRIGGIVRAAAAGTVESVEPDPLSAGRFIVQIEHIIGEHHYRTTYTNFLSVNADIAPQEVVRAGQPIGQAGTQTTAANRGTPGTVYAMTHFQLDDFEYYREIPNPNAVSPEPFLTADAKSFFDGLWSNAAYLHELVEPFATNPRDLRFPTNRIWTRAGGDGPAGIRFIRDNATSPALQYHLLAESGTVIESGDVALNSSARPYPFIDLISPTAVHIGIYDVVSNELRLSLTNSGSQRPLDLSATSVYRTAR
jgi:hypothetical protein